MLYSVGVNDVTLESVNPHVLAPSLPAAMFPRMQLHVHCPRHFSINRTTTSHGLSHAHHSLRVTAALEIFGLGLGLGLVALALTVLALLTSLDYSRKQLATI